MESLIVIVIQYSVNKLKLRNGGQVLGKQSTQQNRKMADTDPSMWTNTKQVKATNLVLSRRTGGAGGFSPSSDRLLDILPAGQVTVLTSLGPVTHS